MKFNVYNVTQGVLFSSLSAVSAVTFNWPMIDLLRNKDELTEWAVSAFKCDQQKGKGNMENQSIKNKGKHRK